MIFNNYNKIANNIYDNSLVITENLNRIISSNGYNITNSDLFCSISLLFCFYFFELLLNNNYSFDEIKRKKILNILLNELDYHSNSIKEGLTFDAYNQVKENLSSDEILKDKIISIPASFLYLSLGDNSDKLLNNTLLLSAIYQQFENILKDVYKLK